MERDRKNDKVQNIREEYDRLFREHYRSITFIAFNYLKDEARAENVAQDVFMKLWEERDKLDFSKSLFPWLSTVTRNQCLNILKGDKVRLRYRNERYQKAIELKEDLIRNSSDFILHHKEIERALYQSLDGMSDKIKETFILCKIDGLKYKEAAKKLNISPKTVEYRIMVALRVLRKELKRFLILLVLFPF